MSMQRWDDLLRDIAVLGLDLAVGKELLDCVNGDCLVDVTSGAGLLTALVADSSSDCR